MHIILKEYKFTFPWIKFLMVFKIKKYATAAIHTSKQIIILNTNKVIFLKFLNLIFFKFMLHRF